MWMLNAQVVCNVVYLWILECAWVQVSFSNIHNSQSLLHLWKNDIGSIQSLEIWNYTHCCSLQEQVDPWSDHGPHKGSVVHLGMTSTHPTNRNPLSPLFHYPLIPHLHQLEALRVETVPLADRHRLQQGLFLLRAPRRLQLVHGREVEEHALVEVERWVLLHQALQLAQGLL